jgi:hypothetical protein
MAVPAMYAIPTQKSSTTSCLGVSLSSLKSNRGTLKYPRSANQVVLITRGISSKN